MTPVASELSEVIACGDITPITVLLERTCDLSPQRVVIEVGSRHYTYAQIRTQAHALSTELAKVLPHAGVVAVVGHRSAEVISPCAFKK
jgi:non-ribosomal peptide synthetase component F